MIIRILPSLENRRQWIDFCRREVPYCFVQTPDTLVDFQGSHLIITLLNRQVRNGRQAVKYSIGSRTSVKPAWEFIKACDFSLGYMVQGLEATRFDGNVRDNGFLRRAPDISVRKFFAKEQAIISPSLLGPLEALEQLPAHWDIQLCCRLLAHEQFSELRYEGRTLNSEKPYIPSAKNVLLELISAPERWQVSLRNNRLWLLVGQTIKYSLLPGIVAPPLPQSLPPAPSKQLVRLQR